MDTFLIFFFIFGIAGFCIWRLLLFSKDRYGENSPLKVARTYNSDFLDYFTSIDHLLSYPFGVLVILFMFLLVKPTITQTTGYNLAVYLMIILGALICMYIFTYHMIFHFHYWDFTKDITLTTSPTDHSIRLNIQGKDYVLAGSNIERVVYTSNNTKMHFAYYKYYLKNGESFVLTDRTPGLWVMKEYFRKIPIELSYQYFPFIK
jgi:hypothetical protein